MSSIKGYPSQKRIPSKGKSNEAFVSVVPIDNNRSGLDVLPKAIYPVSLTPVVCEQVTQDQFPDTKNAPLRIIRVTGHTVQANDIIRFTTGPNQDLEMHVAVVDTDIIYLSGELKADPNTTEFLQMRSKTLTVDENGNLTISQGPTQYILDGANEEVEEDTVNAANNRPLPIKLFFDKDGTMVPVIKDTATASNTAAIPVEIVAASGTEINVTAGDINVQTTHLGVNFDSQRIGDGTNLWTINASNEGLVRDADSIAELQAANVLLTSLDGKDFATETTLAALQVLLTSLDGKDYSTETTLEAARVLLASLDGKDFATETTLATLGTEATLEAARVLLASLDGKDFATQTTLAALEAKAATEAKQDDIITALGLLVPSASTIRVIDSSSTASPTIPNGSRLATVTVPASTRATELEVLCKAGDSFTAYDAATGGNVIGRFTQAGGKIPVNLAAGVQVHLEADFAGFTASDLSINLIGETV